MLADGRTAYPLLMLPNHLDLPPQERGVGEKAWKLHQNFWEIAVWTCVELCGAVWRLDSPPLLLH